MFRTQYDTPIRKYTNCGSPEKIVYGSKLDKNGDIVLYVKGKENIYKLIQADADSVDINLMLKKFMAGDEEALIKRKAFYEDITDMPDSRFEAINLVNESKWTFEELPVRVKEKFDNNFEKWLATAQTPDWYEKMEMVKDVSVKNNVNSNVDYMVNSNGNVDINVQEVNNV